MYWKRHSSLTLLDELFFGERALIFRVNKCNSMQLKSGIQNRSLDTKHMIPYV